MRQIAKEVGVNQAALYHYTPTKQDLLADVLTRHMDGLIAAWAAEDKPDDVVAALDHFTRFHIRYHMPRPDEIFVSYMELRSLEEIISRRLPPCGETMKMDCARSSPAGLTKVSLPSRTLIAAMAILSMLTGITTWYKSGGRLRPEDIENQYSQLALSAVGCPPAAMS